MLISECAAHHMLPPVLIPAPDKPRPAQAPQSGDGGGKRNICLGGLGRGAGHAISASVRVPATGAPLPTS